MDVVDEQLDVAGLAGQPGDEGDRGAGGHEDGQLRQTTAVAGAEHLLQPVEGSHVRSSGETTGDPDGDHCRSQTVAHVHDGIGKGAAGER